MTDALTVGSLEYRFVGRAHANALARLPAFFTDAPAVPRDVLDAVRRSDDRGERVSVAVSGRERCRRRDHRVTVPR